MTAVTSENEAEEDLDSLIDAVTSAGNDSATPARGAAVPKGGAVPVRRSPAQIKAAEARAVRQAEEDSLRAAADAKKAAAARLAQIVNLHIAGYSLAEIGTSIGATEAEVDRMLSADTARYVKSQPALRTYVRNYISGKYTELLETVWDRATDDQHVENLEAQDRALRILDRMGRLHGAEAPVQSEVKVESAPEAVEELVKRLASAQGLGYNMNVFDTVSGTVVHSDIERAVEQSARALEVSGNAVEESDGDDSL